MKTRTATRSRLPVFQRGWIVAAAIAACCLSPAAVHAADDCEDLYHAGEYEKCIETAARGIADREYGEKWYLWKAAAEQAIGRYGDALDTLTAGIERYNWSVRLRIAGLEICRLNDRASQADGWLQEAESLAVRSSWRYTDSENLLALGQAALELGGNPRDILEGFFVRARKLAPQDPEPLVAMGNIALDKSDHALATEWFQEALELSEKRPDIYYGLAVAADDPQKSAEFLEQALELNPRHLPSLVLQTERLLAREFYAEAHDQLTAILSVDPHFPKGWALLSVIDAVHADTAGAEVYRRLALAPWPSNPEVDYVIGRELSKKYRFREAVDALRQSLKFDETYLPAMRQLAQDLLRLGQDEEGWQLAAAAHDADGYDVTTYNLLELKDRLAKYRTIESEHFVIRMDQQEADVYGAYVVKLLEDAWTDLTERYRHVPQTPIFVEIFPHANDFAVRTFGIPGGSGYLGVCFGRLITANSPAAVDSPANWEAVLWHEFAHVVTLEATRNRMPRWLSEGISVSEERRRSAAWGQRMTPDSRRRILSGGLHSIGEMSAAFLNPRSGADLNFAYYEASLIVDYLQETYGFDALVNVLEDLAVGLSIDEALERRTASLEQLDVEFAEYARRLAIGYGASADWTRVDLTAILSDDDPERLKNWIAEHPNHVQGLMAYAQQLIEQQNWQAATEPLERVVEHVPDWTGGDGPYPLLAAVYRRLDRTEDERQLLERYVSQKTEALDMTLRLCELAEQAEDWPALQKGAESLIAVNPLLAAPHRYLAKAAGKRGDDRQAILAYRSLLTLDEWNAGSVHFELARLLHRQQHPDAKFHVIAALEASPRFREAHELLLEIVGDRPAADRSAPASAATPAVP